LETGLVISLYGDRVDGYTVETRDGDNASQFMHTHDAGAALFAYKAIRVVLEFLISEASLPPATDVVVALHR
jgi:hypothetical protein